tara:strand:- start:975 stop:2000 length:1026 start_codon:yes stop_codon:yes gene_type:complete
MSGGGGSGSDGGGDMQVSGAEAAYSTEKGISTAADTRVQRESFSPGGQDKPVGSSMSLGAADTGYQVGKVDPGLAKATLGPDTSTVGIMNRDSILEKDVLGNFNKTKDYSVSEIEKGYTDKGVKIDQVGAGKYMTKQQQYNTGLIEKDPLTGEDKQGRYRVNENTGELERTDLSFADHWKNAPGALKASPTLRLLYASGKNIGEWMSEKGFEGYSEAGKRSNDFLGNISGSGEGTSRGGAGDYTGGAGEGQDQQRAIMNALAPEAPYIVSGTTQPTSSTAANWFSNLGSTTQGFNLATEYAAAKSKVAQRLGTSSAVGQLAVNQSSFFNWLKDNSLDKGIL